MRWFPFGRDRGLDQEVEAHLAMLAERFQRRGMPPEEARQAARRQFGNIPLLKETRRDMSPFASLETLWQDIRFGVRTLKRSPGVTAVIILTFMLGIGINAALFSIIHAVLLKPLPFRDPDRLVYIGETVANSPLEGVGAPDFEDWRSQARSFESMAGITAIDMHLTINGDTAEVRVVNTLESVTNVLGVSPVLGRDFRPGEVRPRLGGTPQNVALIGDRLFRRSFGGGRTRKNSRP